MLFVGDEAVNVEYFKATESDLLSRCKTIRHLPCVMRRPSVALCRIQGCKSATLSDGKSDVFMNFQVLGKFLIKDMNTFINVEDIGNLQQALAEAQEIKNDRFKYQHLGKNKTLMMISSTTVCAHDSARRRQP